MVVINISNQFIHKRSGDCPGWSLNHLLCMTTFTRVIQRRFAIRVDSVPSWKLAHARGGTCPGAQGERMSGRNMLSPSVCHTGGGGSVENGWEEPVKHFCVPETIGPVLTIWAQRLPWAALAARIDCVPQQLQQQQQRLAVYESSIHHTSPGWLHGSTAHSQSRQSSDRHQQSAHAGSRLRLTTPGNQLRIADWLSWSM